MYIKEIIFGIGFYVIYNLTSIFYNRELLLNYFFILNKKYVQFQMFFDNIYKTNEYVKKTVDFFNKYMLKIKSIICNFKIEPEDSVWLSTFIYCPLKRKLLEYYTYFDVKEMHINSYVENKVKENYRLIANIYSKDKVYEKPYEDHTEHTNVMIKYFNTYLIRRKINKDKIKNITFEKCPIYFLTIEYTHPKQKESISLDIPRSMYIVGNELFTPSFILRCLNYQSKNFCFDTNYVLKLVDRDVNIIELRNNQYIELNKNNYSVENFV
jgi:hypothetical protein